MSFTLRELLGELDTLPTIRPRRASTSPRGRRDKAWRDASAKKGRFSTTVVFTVEGAAALERLDQLGRWSSRSLAVSEAVCVYADAPERCDLDASTRELLARLAEAGGCSPGQVIGFALRLLDRESLAGEVRL